MTFVKRKTRGISPPTEGAHSISYAREFEDVEEERRIQGHLRQAA
jgi:hypothetical protein